MSAEKIEQFRLLIPHFIRAARLMGRFRALNHRVGSLRQAFDALGDAVFLVNAHGAIKEANAAGEQAIRDAGPVGLVRGHVTLRHPVASRRLRALVQDAFERGSNHELALSSREGATHVVEIIPARATPTSPACVMIVLRVREALLDRRIRALSSELRLSRRQSLVARHLAEGRSYDEIAGRLRCSVNSVKTHVRRLYEKTDCRDRLGLLRMLAQF